MAKLLLNTGYDIHLVDNNGLDSLMYLIPSSDSQKSKYKATDEAILLSLVQELIDKGISPKNVSKDQQTALGLTVYSIYMLKHLTSILIFYFI